MSERFPGGIISKTAPVPTGPYETGTAPGIWTLDQQAEFVKQGIWPIAGLTPTYIEDVFSTWLYTGNGSTQTITNGIDLAGEGGLVWLKARSTTGESALFDTDRGTGTLLTTSSTREARSETGFGAYLSDGFSFAGAGSTVAINFDGRTFASWTFRKQPKFFDVVTWSGDGTGTGRQISHSLGSAPGCIILKSTSTAGTNWIVYHRSLATNFTLKLQTTDAAVSNAWISTVTDTYFTGSGSAMNVSGQTYVAYLFAHDAGGFGEDGEQNVVSCGSYTGNGTSSNEITLGYEPQWIMVKKSSSTGSWLMFDNMRGWATTQQQILEAQSAGREYNFQVEYAGEPFGEPTATGFRLTSGYTASNASGSTYIYIAIRRGPMKVPESGTEVFEPDLSPNSNNPRFVSGFPVDMAMSRLRTSDGVEGMDITSRLTQLQYMRTGSTNAEAGSSTLRMDYMNGFDNDGDTSPNFVAEMFRRAPGFFDVVCYTGTGANTTQAHNLAAAPEMMIVKKRSSATASDWYVYHSGMVDLTYPNPATQYIRLNLTNNWVRGSSGAWNNTQPTSSVFSLGDTSATNASGQTFVAYLFATLAGVSKVGSYTGTATTLQINCGFTTGARFVLIKRTDSTGDWYVWDSARGIVAGDDPYLLLNSTAAEVTNTDYVDTYSAGFEITSTAPAAINASGGSFIFLAIA